MARGSRRDSPLSSSTVAACAPARRLDAAKHPEGPKIARLRAATASRNERLTLSSLGRRRQSPTAHLSALAVRLATGVSLPLPAVDAAFTVFGAASSAAQLHLLWNTVCSRDPGMQRLRRRAVRAVGDYRTIVQWRPDLASVMKLDFTILFGLYSDALDISLRQAVDMGLVETYCRLAGLIEAYDDLIDTAEARRARLTPDDFRGGRLGLLRADLVAHFQRLAERLPRAAELPASLAGFELQAWEAHQQLDLGAGLDASLEEVVMARAATSGLLLRFAAHLWSVLLCLPPDLARSSEDAAATFGLVAQFADDVMDWSTDDGNAQNLLGAALREFPEELVLARTAIRQSPGWSLSVRWLMRNAPKSMGRLALSRQQAATYPPDARYAGLAEFASDVYSSLLPRLPAIHFTVFDRVRDDVQVALATLR